LHINKLSTSNDKKLDKILSKHATVFKGLGKLKDVKVQLNIDQDQTPKIQPNRRIPFHICNNVKKVLEELEHEDVIE
jgi:hypothetical protein